MIQGIHEAMILSIREYPEDTNTVERNDSTTDGNDVANTNIADYQFEYIVDMTTIESRKPVTFKRKGPRLMQEEDKGVSGGFLWKHLSYVFVKLFLPVGYPHSVDASYLPYQLFDGLQGLCSYWRGVVATQAVLEAAGVGDSTATAASAAMQWALRDGTGMVGGLVFSYVASQHLDTHVKEFRLFADVINDVAMTLDMLAPYAKPDWRLMILSLSTIGKTLCGMAAGATKGRITQHFSRHGNMADLGAKESTQETLVSLLGMIGGVAVADLLRTLPYEWTWFLFGLLTILHVWANYKAVKLLRLASLNPERASEVLKPVLEVLKRKGEDEELEKSMEALRPPDEINESLASSALKLLFPSIHLDPPVIARNFQFVNAFSKERYMIGASTSRHLYVYLGLGAAMRDELTAYAHALLVQMCIGEKPINLDLFQS